MPCRQADTLSGFRELLSSHLVQGKGHGHSLPETSRVHVLRSPVPATHQQKQKVQKVAHLTMPSSRSSSARSGRTWSPSRGSAARSIAAASPKLPAAAMTTLTVVAPGSAPA